MKFTGIVLALLILDACAGIPLTEAELDMRAADELERIEQYTRWKAGCNGNKLIYAHNPIRPCRRKECIPHRLDWRWDANRERPRIGNAYQCISNNELRRILGR